jgi:aminomuconate-semialdehyde/2-hydroxymuconate-6-semialdehyde dehydrogenase
MPPSPPPPVPSSRGAGRRRRRSERLIRVAELIEENFDELARLESEDSGKPIGLARRMDVPRAILNFRFFATAILHTETRAHVMDDRALNYTLRQPLGVAGLISPWNLPLYLLTWKIAPAIAAGNCCVAKPSELTPLTADRLAALIAEAGIPPGVVNIVHGPGGTAGRALTSHPKVPLISFTGGTKTGVDGQWPLRPLFKKVSLELGGKNPKSCSRTPISAGRPPRSVEFSNRNLPLRIAPVRRRRSTASSSNASSRGRKNFGSEIRRTRRPTSVRS